MKATVDVLKGDTQRVSNNEVELSKLWHTIHTETKSIYDNRQMIEGLQSNLTKQVDINLKKYKTTQNLITVNTREYPSRSFYKD